MPRTGYYIRYAEVSYGGMVYKYTLIHSEKPICFYVREKKFPIKNGKKMVIGLPGSDVTYVDTDAEEE